MDPIEQSPEFIIPSSSEAEARAAKWESSMNADDVPTFSGEDFFSGNVDTPPTNEANDDNEYDPSLSDAAALVSYGLDAAAMRIGVEATIQRIKSFDASNSTDPIKDLYDYLGIGENPTREEVRDTAAAMKDDTDAMREEIGAPARAPKTAAAAFKAIEDMKELITEVEGADPVYASLRESAESSGKGYFEYAVGASEGRSLSDLLLALREQKDRPDSVEADTSDSTTEDSNNPNSDALGPDTSELTASESSKFDPTTFQIPTPPENVL